MHPKQLAYQAVPGWSFASRFCWNAAACNGQRERVCTDPVTSLRISSAKSSGSGSSPRATIKPRASSWPPACSPKVLNLQSGPMVRDGSNPGIRGGTEAGGASRAEGARSSGDTTPTTARSKVAPKQQQHILESDSTGGGHRVGLVSRARASFRFIGQTTKSSIKSRLSQMTRPHPARQAETELPLCEAAVMAST